MGIKIDFQSGNPLNPRHPSSDDTPIYSLDIGVFSLFKALQCDRLQCGDSSTQVPQQTRLPGWKERSPLTESHQSALKRNRCGAWGVARHEATVIRELSFADI